MGTPSGLVVPALMLGLTLAASPAAAQMVAPRGPERVTNVATSLSGHIEGTVLDEAGRPLDGVVISALGGTTAFAVSDKSGQFVLRQLAAGSLSRSRAPSGISQHREARSSTSGPRSAHLRRSRCGERERRTRRASSDASVGATQIDAPPAARAIATRARWRGSCAT